MGFRWSALVSDDKHPVDWVKYNTDFRIEAFKATIQYGLNASRGVFLINGGAVLALLTFVGNAHVVTFNMPWMLAALGTFILGLILALACTGAAYWSQGKFSRQTEDADARWWQKISVAFGILSALAFLAGAGLAGFSVWYAM
jgi:hypothetical protein